MLNLYFIVIFFFFLLLIKFNQDQSSMKFSYLKCIIVLLLGFFAGYLEVQFIYVVAGILVWSWYWHRKPSSHPSEIKPQDKAKEQTKAPHKVADKEFEKVQCLSVIMEHMWPYLSKYLVKFLKQKIQPKLRSKSRYLSNFCFFDIDFGKKAPQVTHMRVQSDPEKKQIIMDLQIKYNAPVKLDVGLSERAALARVNNVKLEGTFRIIFAPLMGNKPLIGALTFYFPQRPALQLDWTGLTRLLDIPGLHSLTNRKIVEKIATFLVSPKHITKRITSKCDVTELHFKERKNAVRIHVLEARNLVAKDFYTKKSDPFVVVRGGGKTFKTRVISKTLNPEWKQTFEILFSELPGQEIEFQLWDRDVARDDPMGSCKIAVSQVLKKKCVDKWIRLQNVKSGELHIKVECLRLLSDPAKLNKVIKQNKLIQSPKSEELSSAVLYTVIQKAKGLPVIRPKKSKLNPLAKVQVTVGDTVKRSGGKINTTGEPEWKKRIQFLIKNPLNEELKLKVRNEQNKVLGRASVPLSRLMNANDMTIENWFPLKSKGKTSEILLKLQLRILAPRKLV
ncbi:extended synaptotagmin-1-like [Xenopus laevis]|uniref:Extended synaptotagmin-1-like n=1 Tax=Xenopus laevis TaxID=8355 RepID=A0A8J1MZH4_XENLA|nr:extended synaptotagmin-1-like [Xenopus laevis]